MSKKNVLQYVIYMVFFLHIDMQARIPVGTSPGYLRDIPRLMRLIQPGGIEPQPGGVPLKPPWDHVDVPSFCPCVSMILYLHNI